MARPFCNFANKVRFPSKLESDLAIADILRSNSHNRHRRFREEPVGSERCRACNGWHMTNHLSRNRESVSN